MNKDSNKTIMVIALISIFLCGCPGVGLFIPGVNALVNAFLNADINGTAWDAFGSGLLDGGYMICLAGLLIPIPIILLIVALVRKSKKKALEKLEPTGVSKDEPLPPTS